MSFEKPTSCRPLVLPLAGSKADYQHAAELALRKCQRCRKPIGRGVRFWFLGICRPEVVHAECLGRAKR